MHVQEVEQELSSMPAGIRLQLGHSRQHLDYVLQLTSLEVYNSQSLKKL